MSIQRYTLYLYSMLMLGLMACAAPQLAVEQPSVPAATDSLTNEGTLTVAQTRPPSSTVEANASTAVPTLPATQLPNATPPAPTITLASNASACTITWFFVNEPQAGCPREVALPSTAAAQRFERGMMIWVEQIGRYFILSDAQLQTGDVRKRIDFVNDPLDILRDTSAQITPPAGLYAPVSGFGLVWRGDVAHSPGFVESLGWALAPELSYAAQYQCDDARPSGGQNWSFCYLQGPDAEVIVIHPLGGWYRLGDK